MGLSVPPNPAGCPFYPNSMGGHGRRDPPSLLTFCQIVSV